MPITFGTTKRGTQWLIIKTEEAPGSNDCQKLGDGWKNRKKTGKHRSPRLKMAGEERIVEVKIIADPGAALPVGAFARLTSKKEGDIVAGYVRRRFP